MKALWISLLPRALDRGGGAAYSEGLKAYFEKDRGYIYEDLFVLPSNPTFRKFKLLVSLLMSVVFPRSAKIMYCFSIATIFKVLASKADCIICDHVETAYLIRFFRGQNIVVLHNVESDLMMQRARQFRGLRARFLMVEAGRLQKFELAVVDRADEVISLAPEDICRFRALGVRADIRHIPPKFGYPSHSVYVPRPVLTLGFLGNLNWWPNQQGLEWYLSEVHPFHKLDLVVYGLGGERIGKASDRVEFKGFVSDLADVWRAVDLMIVPIISGSGVSIKTAETIYNGVPVLSTSSGARGIDKIPEDQGLIVRDGAMAWVDYLNNLTEGAGVKGPPSLVRQRFAV